MSTTRPPGRRQPPPRRRPPAPRPGAATFRRRRIFAFIVLLLLIGGIVAGVWALKNRFFPSDQPAPEPSAEEPAGPTEEDLANPTDCAAGALEVSIDLAADSLPAGQSANLPVTIRNNGEVPCVFDASQASIAVVITSGDDAVWSSSHCGGGLPQERRLLLDVGASDTTLVAWDGNRSEAGCPGEQARAEPGTYRVKATVTSGSTEIVEEQVFGLS